MFVIFNLFQSFIDGLMIAGLLVQGANSIGHSPYRRLWAGDDRNGDGSLGGALDD
jgi:hypothetical protein